MNWKDVLSQVAPTIATLVGGPMAGMGVKALSQVLLGHDKGTLDDVTKAFSNITPEQLAALKKADADLKLQLAQLGIKAEELDVQDRDSARKLAIARGFLPQVVLSVVFVGGYFGLVYELVLRTIVLKDMSAVQVTLITSLVSVLTASVVQIVNFWFGSSHGSQKKDAALSQAALGS